MKQIYATDARELKEFNRLGYHYTKIEETEDYMVWEMEQEGKTVGYEVWKRKNYRNPDGNVIWAKPSDEDFGRYGWYTPIKSRVQTIIETRLNQYEEE